MLGFKRATARILPLKNEGASREPSPDELRAARHTGFADAVSYMTDRRRERLMSSYLEQDRRWERHVRIFMDDLNTQDGVE